MIRRESTILWGGSQIPIPNLKIDSSKINDFGSVIREIDNEFQLQITALEKERKDRISVQENRIIDEVKEKIKVQKAAAVQDFIKSLGSYLVNSDSLVLLENVISPTSPLDDSSLSEVSMADDHVLCTICQDNILRKVTLPCRHSFCYDCLREYVKDKIDSCQLRKRGIEIFVIPCPNCKYPYNYLDEFDDWEKPKWL